MADHPDNWPRAHDAATANAIALQDAAQCLRTLPGLTTRQQNWVAAQIILLPPFQNLHKNCQPSSPNSLVGSFGPVVQVNATIVIPSQRRLQIEVMLDVDDPPLDSLNPRAQPPHFGWEVKVDEQRMGNGHVALPAGVLTFGRTFKGNSLETYGYDVKEDMLTNRPQKPDGVDVTVSFKRYK